MKKKIGLLLIILIALILLLIRFIPNEKTRLVNDIKKMKNAVEKENRSDLLIYIDSTYQDQKGAAYQDIIAIIDGLFNDYDSINVVMKDLQVNIDSTKDGTFFGSCSLGLRVFVRYQGELMLVYGGVIQPAPVRGCFRKTSEHYQLYSANY